MNPAARRREAILELLASRRLSTQEELVAALAEKGFEASQASVSRDVAALGLVKRGGVWARPLRDPEAADPRVERISAYLISATGAGGPMLVLKTPPGEAPGVALALDHLNLDGVVGTIAGDDTIFVATADTTAGERVAEHLAEILGGARG